MPKVILKNERTGETFETGSYDTSKDIRKMTYQERLDLYNNDRDMYNHLVSKVTPAPKKTDLSGFKPFDYQGGSRRNIRNDD